MNPRALAASAAVLAAIAIVAVTIPLRPSATPPGAVLVGAGDLTGCEGRSDEETADILDGIAGTVFTLGDNAYPDGGPQEFADCYAPTWGRHLDRTRPAPGNHDYGTPDAAGYFGYFAGRAGTPGEGWYSYDAATWHVVVLNSVCDHVRGGCEPGSPQLRWLEADLAEHVSRCILAYWHSPRFSSGEHGDERSVQPFWDALAAAGADIVLNGDDHDYERFTPLDAAGQPSPDGIREFVVGTGGAGLRPFASPRPGSEFRRADLHGVLRLGLRDGEYDWSFVAAPDGQVVDEGQGQCG